MAISMLDQMLFKLSCGHKVVLGRLLGTKDWICEECHQTTDLSSGPTTLIAQMLDLFAPISKSTTRA